MKAVVIAISISILWAVAARAEISVYDCAFDGLDFTLTVYDDGSPARIGVEVGVGDKAQVYLDRGFSEAVVAVEFNGTGQPITLTTIDAKGRANHSRHNLGPNRIMPPSQFVGTCSHRTIR